MDLNNFLLFALASLMLNLTPGNDMLYVASRSTGQGIKAGIVSAFGIMGGGLVHTLGAVIGLSAIIARSALAFDIIKYLGAAYLVYLGLRSVISKSNAAFVVPGKMVSIPLTQVFYQGIITNVLNPKVALFFLAFLPQFITQGRGNEPGQILFLGIYFNLSGTIVNILVAVLFGKLGNWFSKSPKFIRVQQKVTGIVLIALGVKIALSSRE
ncbi:MAG: LysE family translocator [Chitinophagaceae bacterium]